MVFECFGIFEMEWLLRFCGIKELLVLLLLFTGVQEIILVEEFLFVKGLDNVSSESKLNSEKS